MPEPVRALRPLGPAAVTGAYDQYPIDIRLHHRPVRLTLLLAGCYPELLKSLGSSAFRYNIMDDTLHALGEILLKAVPTFLLVVLLHFYLKKIFFQPMEKVLHQRFEATEGARKLAEQSLARASARTAEYEAAIRAARSEVYQAQEQLYRQLQESEAAQLAAARQTRRSRRARSQGATGPRRGSGQIEPGAYSDALAGEIADSILEIEGTAA